jgi:hypothetical protein
VWDRAGATLSISVRAGRFVVEPSCAGPARSLAAGDWQRLACPLRGIAGGPGSSPLRSPAAAGDIAAREDALETSGPADDPSLVAYWPFDEVEGSTIAADWTGHDHAAKLHRQGVESRFAEGLMGGALLLDRGYAEVAAGPGDDLGIGADGLTVAAWLYRVRDGLTFEMVASRQSGTSDGEHFALGFYQNQLALLIETQPPEITVKDWGLVPNDRWVHVAGTYDGSTASLYVDGREVARAPVARQIAPDMTPVLIGGNANGPRRLVTENFPGRIDDLRIYRRALRPAEVERLARFPSR